ncbi:hypothetical protein EVAR_47284_1 [Eumeta japonica]|uniref:Uncharacterized protein n=1 Tax=Eumeta variegata TaxID=151549 RepID=A0A4C1YXI4_EUMVA|nr:hypothetical protein EVAR_47284_1 [Eumeta japonica]
MFNGLTSGCPRTSLFARFNILHHVIETVSLRCYRYFPKSCTCHNHDSFDFYIIDPRRPAGARRESSMTCFDNADASVNSLIVSFVRVLPKRGPTI